MLARLQGPLVCGRLSLPGRRVPAASTHRHLSRRVRVPRPRHDLQHHAQVPRRHGQDDALPVQLGPEPLRLRAVRRARLPPLQQRRGRRPARPRGRSGAADRKAARGGIHSRGLARRLRGRPHRIGSHDELLPHGLRHRQPFRHHAPRSPGDRLAQAQGRALLWNRRGLGPDLAEVRRRSPDRASHGQGRAVGRDVVAPAGALRTPRRPDGVVVRGNRRHDGRDADGGHGGAAVRGGRDRDDGPLGPGPLGRQVRLGARRRRSRSPPGGPSGTRPT